MRLDGQFKNRGFRDASLNAFFGFICLIKESAAKRELMLLMVSGALGIYEATPLTLTLIAISVMMLVVESINTAIEGLCDCITLDYDDRIRRIKDLGACAVFILSVSYALTLAKFFWGMVS